mgnify:CR=1 FL=1
MSKYSKFDPLELLEELARQNKELYQQFEIITANQHAIAHSLNACTNRQNAQGQMINQLKREIQQLRYGDINEETNSRPTR